MKISDQSDQFKKDSAFGRNALALEKSPYLLQHADNPVNWYPWGAAAFDKAVREDKPIFLSIGYSTCHWCHVMEHDSFESDDVAAILNEHYVSVKVDREERPDIDHVYMDVCMAMTGSGGWPLTIIMTPEKKPFFAATFIPADDRYGMRGLKSVLTEIDAAWHGRRDEILGSADKVVQFINKEIADDGKEKVTEKTFDRVFEIFSQLYDSKYGGIGGQGPKFPQSHLYTFLLHYWKRTGNAYALDMAATTLDRMARGGMYDQAGGGFHRYSVDEKWLVPHFEKMLYDQAILSRSYLEAYQATGRGEFARTAADIFEYVLRDMTSPEGAFYSAEDADSEGHEGKFYVWTAEEFRRVLEDHAALMSAYYGVSDDGNFENNTNILNVTEPQAAFAKKQNISESDLGKTVAHARKLLFAARSARVRPHRDDKILCAWNGLMISSLAYGARALDEPRYAAAAARAADFILDNMAAGGRLMRRHRDGEAAVPAFIDDYAFLTNGLIDLFEATQDIRRLQQARDLAGRMLDLFWDYKQNSFTFGAGDNEQLIKSVRDAQDGAEPSGNSVAALALARLWRYTGNERYRDRAEQILDTFSPFIAKYPLGFTQMLIAADFLFGPVNEVVIAGPAGDPRAQDMIFFANSVYHPNHILILHDPENTKPELEEFTPLVKNKDMKDGRATAYVCRNFTCRKPTTDPDELKRQLQGK